MNMTVAPPEMYLQGEDIRVHMLNTDRRYVSMPRLTADTTRTLQLLYPSFLLCLTTHMVSIEQLPQRSYPFEL